ncbi:hypothetical protein NE237_018762 [Protea cynaroides]|uniref:Phytocyanin domain-containing protein n=1 Tax=Protea cynaroides TaxID=273540 RepID=A0A9Q0QPB6_9MAGN|nr:hypothetical protein NE237_018762 [Protea cynaroides]
MDICGRVAGSSQSVVGVLVGQLPENEPGSSVLGIDASSNRVAAKKSSKEPERGAWEFQRGALVGVAQVSVATEDAIIVLIWEQYRKVFNLGLLQGGTQCQIQGCESMLYAMSSHVGDLFLVVAGILVDQRMEQGIPLGIKRVVVGMGRRNLWLLSHVWCVYVAAMFWLEGMNPGLGSYLNFGGLLGFLSMEPDSVPLKEKKSAMMVEPGKGATTNRPANLASIRVGAEKPSIGEVPVRIAEAAVTAAGKWSDYTRLMAHFYVVVFKYKPMEHNVVVVDQFNYNRCIAASGSKLYDTREDHIVLAKGQNYFICAKPGHCYNDKMKIAVNAL